MTSIPPIDTRTIAARRPDKNLVDPQLPYGFLVEPERSREGAIVDVATIFLTNRECPFRCLMCDLWKNTTNHRVLRGAIPTQIDHALARLPPATHIKLYNSGNFFDRQAIPPADYAAIAARVQGFRNVIVENHPRLCGEACLDFKSLLIPPLEIALGLETVHPQVLAALNKQMTVADFCRACEFLRDHGIQTRAFVLLKPPWLSEQEGIEWALRSVEFAFAQGVDCCAIIPTRGGNGVMELLQHQGHFQPPRLASLERCLEEGLGFSRGRVFVDVWEANRFASCQRCAPARIERLQQMNLTQQVQPAIRCDCGTDG